MSSIINFQISRARPELVQHNVKKTKKKTVIGPNCALTPPAELAKIPGLNMVQVVLDADAIVYPFAVMIELIDTSITPSAVFTCLIHIRIAILAEKEIFAGLIELFILVLAIVEVKVKLVKKKLIASDVTFIFYFFKQIVIARDSGSSYKSRAHYSASRFRKKREKKLYVSACSWEI